MGDPVVAVVPPESGVCRGSALCRLESPELVCLRPSLSGGTFSLGCTVRRDGSSGSSSLGCSSRRDGSGGYLSGLPGGALSLGRRDSSGGYSPSLSERH